MLKNKCVIMATFIWVAQRLRNKLYSIDQRSKVVILRTYIAHSWIWQVSLKISVYMEEYVYIRGCAMSIM